MCLRSRKPIHPRPQPPLPPVAARNNASSIISKMNPPITCLAWLAFAFLVAAVPAGAEDKPVSFYKDVFPIFKRSCNGCHHPGKLKGQLDLTTYEAFQKGGKHGAAFKAGDPKESILMEEISGAEPSMPKEGDALTKEEVALMERWIREGAKDDTPANANSFK